VTVLALTGAAADTLLDTLVARGAMQDDAGPPTPGTPRGTRAVDF